MASEYGSEINYQQKFTRKPVSTKAYFDGLSAKAKKIADKIAHEHALKMQRKLVFRQLLKSVKNGKWPRWGNGPHPDSKHNSNKSFEGWRVSVIGGGVYSLHNARVSDDTWGYSYVKNLANGTGWSWKSKAGVGKKDARLIKRGGKIFSTQMPFGLAPWLREEREDLKKEIKQGVKDIV